MEGDERPLFFFNALEVLPALGATELLRHIDPTYPVYLARSALLTRLRTARWRARPAPTRRWTRVPAISQSRCANGSYYA